MVVSGADLPGGGDELRGPWDQEGEEWLVEADQPSYGRCVLTEDWAACEAFGARAGVMAVRGAWPDRTGA